MAPLHRLNVAAVFAIKLIDKDLLPTLRPTTGNPLVPARNHDVVGIQFVSAFPLLGKIIALVGFVQFLLRAVVETSSSGQPRTHRRYLRVRGST